MYLQQVELLIGLLFGVAALAWLAARVKVPYPILMVIGGLLIGLLPGLPRVGLDPDLVFLLFLPPLLYRAGLETSWRDFTANIRPISMLAVGLVLFTIFGVGLVAKLTIPSLSWPAALALGAIISPTDAIAATAIAQRLGVPKRIVTIIEGESLVNDATALVALSFAIAAAQTGEFSTSGAIGNLILVTAGGIGIGWLAGVVSSKILSRLNDTSIECTISLLTPFLSYMPAHMAGLSGVMAAVTTGLYVGRRLPYISSSRTRLRLDAVWDTLVFLFNGIIFILIGLQIRDVASASNLPLTTLIWYGVVVSAATIIGRLIWVYPVAYLTRLIPAIAKRDPLPPWSHTTIVAWTGMRGIVSLAAALSIPLVGFKGQPFPGRDIIIFVTFCVIVATLVLQGLTLAPLIRKLGLTADHQEEFIEDSTARYLIALAGVERLDALVAQGAGGKGVTRLREDLDERLSLHSRGISMETMPADPKVGIPTHRVTLEVIGAQREMLVRLRNDGVIGEEVMKRVQKELDLEESRIG